MEDSNKEKLLNHLGSDLLNKLNLGGIVEATKFYCLHLAAQRYEGMSEEDRSQLLETIENEEKDEPNKTN